MLRLTAFSAIFFYGDCIFHSPTVERIGDGLQWVIIQNKQRGISCDFCLTFHCLTDDKADFIMFVGRTNLQNLVDFVDTVGTYHVRRTNKSCSQCVVFRFVIGTYHVANRDISVSKIRIL